MLEKISDLVWSAPLILLIISVGVYFSIKLKWLHLRGVKDIKLILSEKNSDFGVNPIGAFWTAMASRIGIGNIAGTVFAIFYGGPGAVFWIWITSLIGSANSFVECTLGQFYNEHDNGELLGGTFYYAKKGLKLKIVPYVLALLTILVTTFFLPAPQAYTINEVISKEFNVPMYIISLVGTCLLFLTICGSIKRISKVATAMVPMMSTIYIIVTIIIIIFNCDKLIETFYLIISSAFGKNALFGGLWGKAISWGVRRATFSSAAGMGEAVPAAAAANTSHPVKQGIINSLGCYIDVFICTCTAISIMITDCYSVNTKYVGSNVIELSSSSSSDYVGVQYLKMAFTGVFGDYAGLLLAIFVMLFSFSTVLNYYYESESAIKFLCSKKRTIAKFLIWIDRISIAVTYFIFGITNNTTVWSIADIGFGVLIWSNLILLLLLRKDVCRLSVNYENQRRCGLDPTINEL